MQHPEGYVNDSLVPILYGTQTNTARDVAEEIHRLLRRLGLRSRVLSMEEYNIVRNKCF